jgi:hypothetical protein
MQRVFLASLALFSITSCDGTIDDPSMYLTGTEEYALKGATPGAPPTCPSTKVLICHIPPGNPANEHSICVGPPAVAAHQRNHGDTIGACGASSGGTTDVDAGSPPPPPQPPPAPACIDVGGACTATTDCCSGLACNTSLCTPIIP